MKKYLFCHLENQTTKSKSNLKMVCTSEKNGICYSKRKCEYQAKFPPTIGINEIAKEINENAVAHGWWENERPFGEIIALCHSELSEALEAYRNGEKMVWDHDGKPDGIAVEMIDCVIRVFDYLAHEGIDVEEVIRMKHEYNKMRPYKHGCKKI